MNMIQVIQAAGQLLKELFSQEKRMIYLVFALIASYILLIMPDKIVGFFGLADLIQTNREWIGMIAFLATALILAEGISWLVTQQLNKNRLNKNHQKRLRVFQNLSHKESQILSWYFAVQGSNSKASVPQTTSIRLDFNDGVALGLVKKGVLYVSCSEHNNFGHIAFNLEPWVYDYLTAHPETIKEYI